MPKRKQRRPRGQVNETGPGRYQIRVPLGRDGRGVRKYHTETLHGATEPKAWKRVTELLASVYSGEYFEPSRVTVGEYLEREWLPQKARAGVRQHTTMHTYRRLVRSYVLPAIGGMRLRDVAPRHVRDLYNGMQDRGLSTETMRMVRALLKTAFAEAVTLRYLKSNPAAAVKHPKSRNPVRKKHVFTTAQAAVLISAALRDVADYVFVFHLVTGLRPEELRGLRRSDVSRDGSGRGVARVGQVAIKPANEPWVFDDPKTEAGKRPVYFPAHVYDLLLKYFEMVDARRRLAGSAWADFGLAFPSETGRPMNHGTYHKRLKRLLKAAGLPGHFSAYSFRYSFATLSFLAGESDKAISAQMGHSSVDFTKDVYVEALPEMRQALSDRFERLLFADVPEVGKGVM